MPETTAPVYEYSDEEDADDEMVYGASSFINSIIESRRGWDAENAMPMNDSPIVEEHATNLD